MAISKRNQNILLIAMIFAVSMTTIDQTIVALSADTIQKDLGISHTAITWSINAYILATAAFFLLGGKVADVFGHKPIVIIGIIGFALFSLLNSLTPAGDIAAPWLITSRALQGASTALMFPAALGIVLSQFSQNSRGKAVATFFAITGAMTALGPILGGYLTDWTWRAIFWINIPIAIAALALVARQHFSETKTAEPIDWKGGILIAASMALAITGLQQAGTWGWDSHAVWVFIGLGIVLFAAFIQHEASGLKYPLLRIRAFEERGFSLSTLAVLFSSIVFVPLFFFISVYSQISLGLSVTSSALPLLEFFIGFMIASRIGGGIFDKRGAKIPLTVGGAAGVVGFLWWASKLTQLNDGGAFLSSPQFWPTIVAGAGVGFMFSAAATDIANRSPSSSYGEATAISQTAKNFGGALGLAVLATVLTTNLTNNLDNAFMNIGAPKADAERVANDISSGSESSSEAKQFAELPKQTQTELKDAVQESYAEANQPVFYGMSVAMAIVFLIGLAYPKEVKKLRTTEKPAPIT